MTFAEDLRAFVVDRVEALAASHVPDFALPRVLAGHQVGADARADLAFTLGLLARGGTTTVAGLPVEDALVNVLRDVDGAATNTFFSYRVAETLAHWGPFGDNRLVRRLDAEQLAAACDSTSFIPVLKDGRLPKNYAAVLTRCEHARTVLGLPATPAVLDDLIARTVVLLDSNPAGYLDDSNGRIGRYDIYTADIFLFTEPFAHRLGGRWRSGATNAMFLVESVMARNGAAITWGRSTGALALCLTVEMAGLAIRHRLTDDPAAWMARGLAAFESLQAWFDGPLVAAHQYRSTYGYRGPFRRLQMTLDCLGKLADAAIALDGVDLAPVAAPTVRDRIVWFDEPSRAGVWTYSSPELAFVVPLVGATVTDYLPVPSRPGLFEVPVGRDLVTGVPLVFRDGVRYTAGGLPAEVAWQPGQLAVRHRDWRPAGQLEPSEQPPLPGARRAVYRVEGRTLRGEEEMTFDQPPDAVTFMVAETTGRPLRVELDADVDHAVTTVDTAGMKEWRSFWAELPRVHQIDLRPAREITLRWSVTPLLRVLSTAHTHHYDHSLYGPLRGLVATGLASRSKITARALADWDQLHMHWPEWWLGPEVDHHRAALRTLRDTGTRIVWTMHNLVPHDRTKAWDEVYGVWADAADAVIHHTQWGMRRALDRYRFGDRTIHRVIPHGHWGDLMADVASIDRSAVEAEMGLRSGVLRLGIVGSPRPGKRVDLAMEAITRCQRDDVELFMLSLGDEDVPDDRRIVAVPYKMVPRELYNRRLAAIDVLVMPYETGDLLATGTIGDAVGLGLPSIAADWEFLKESLGSSAIYYGQSADDLARCIDNLTAEQLSAAAAAARALQADQSWEAVAGQHLALLEQVGTTKV